MENGNPLNRGSDSSFLLDTFTRTKIDLSGDWNFDVEGGPSGMVRVPSAFDFSGRVTFHRTFEVTPEQLEKYQFQFVMFGVNYNCEVSVNGEFVTNHSGGYTSFVQLLPKNLLQVGKENTVRVVVSNELDARKTIPLRPQVWGWKNYGGILRDVFILGVPKLSIKDAVLHTDISENAASAKVIVKASMEGAEPEAAAPAGKKGPVLGFSIEVFDKISGFSVGRSGVAPLSRQKDEWSEVQSEATIQNPKLWSPDSPELYLLKCYLVQVSGKESTILDEYDLTFGIRKFLATNGNLMLNGKRLQLKGVTWYEDHPAWGSSLPYEQQEKDIVLIKNLGANVVRFINHPPHPYMLNLCDRYGLLAMEELPLVNIPASILADESYLDLAGAMMKEMVVRDRNHPSLMAWGLGDDFEVSQPASRPFVESLVRLARSMDSRPTYLGTRMLSHDGCSSLVDIAAMNVYAQDLRTFKSRLDEWRALHRSQVVIVSKFGTEVQQGNRSGYSDPLSEEAQARFYIQRFDLLKGVEFNGAIVWSLNDWRGDRPSLTVNSGDPWMHAMGLVSGQREKRLAYDAVRSVFHGEKFVALPMGTHAASDPIVYVLAGFVVLIGVAYLYNASRRFRESLKRSILSSFNFFADVRDQRAVSLVHTTVVGLVVSVAMAIVISSILFHFRQNWILDNMLSYVLIYDNAKAFVVHLIWNPLRSIVYFSLVVFLGMFVLTGAVMALRLFFRTRIYPYHAYSVAMWSMSPLLILVPVGMILYRMMESSVYVAPALALVAVLHVWVLLRLLKGISIIFDVHALKVYIVGLCSMFGVLAVLYFYYDYTQSASTYVSFMYHVVTNSQ